MENESRRGEETKINKEERKTVDVLERKKIEEETGGEWSEKRE